MVLLFVNGQEEWILMDDFIPATSHGSPAFVHSDHKGEMWPSFMEKAWAKAAGSYARVEGGWAADAMLHLLGVPNRDYIHSNKDDIKKLQRKIEEGCRRNFQLFGSSQDKSKSTNMYGLINNHAFEIK
jgi:hypothetical protein